MKRIVTLFIVFLVVIGIGIFLEGKKESNIKKEISAGHFKVYGVVEKLKPRSRNGRNYASRKDVVYLYYEKNDTIFHIIEDLPSGQIKKLEINQNDCFLIKIAKYDKDIFSIDFSKKLDTLIDKNNYKNQVYKSMIHKNIIE